MSSVVLTLIRGIFNENAKPLAAATPILRPVKDPGPDATAIAERSLSWILFSSMISFIIRWSFSPWTYLSLLVLLIPQRIPFCPIATEQFLVEVSIFKMRLKTKYLLFSSWVQNFAQDKLFSPVYLQRVSQQYQILKLHLRKADMLYQL